MTTEAHRFSTQDPLLVQLLKVTGALATGLSVALILEVIQKKRTEREREASQMAGEDPITSKYKTMRKQKE